MPGDTAPHVVEDLLGIVQILSDGSVVRGDESVLGPKEPFPDVPGVEWKDVLYHAAHGLRVRVYRPASASSVAGGAKLPVLVYFHGGGYCLGSFAQPTFHASCLRAAAELPAVVLSVQYRLAPEHRLPAAIEDGAAFLSWLRGQAELGAGAEPWLAESADFARTFISGVSAGANLAHHLTVQVATARLPGQPRARRRVRTPLRLLRRRRAHGVGGRHDDGRVPACGDMRAALAHVASGRGEQGPPGGESVRAGEPQPRAGGAPAGSCGGAVGRRAPCPRAGVRGEAQGHGERRRASRVRGTAAWLLRPSAVRRGGRRADASPQAVRVPM
ncbi:hypothetical protein VPH35_043442 [Triticum aestivum]